MKSLKKISALALIAVGMLSLGTAKSYAQASPTPSPTPSLPTVASEQAKLLRIFGTLNPSSKQLQAYAKKNPGQAGNISVALGLVGVSGNPSSSQIAALGQGILSSGKSGSTVQASLTLLYSSALNVASAATVNSGFSSLSVPPKYATSVNITAATNGNVTVSS